MKNFIKLSIAYAVLISCNDTAKFPTDKDNQSNEEEKPNHVRNGVVRTFNDSTKKLLSEIEYYNDTLNGSRIEYYLNGRISSKSYYKMGKIHGPVFIYDTSGFLLRRYYYYYDLKLGERSDFIKGKLANYSFYSLDREVLMEINYNASSKKMITELLSDYFFIDKEKYSIVDTQGLSDTASEYFIYTPNPPEYNFQYELVKANPEYKDLEVVKRFDRGSPFSQFDLIDLVSPNDNRKFFIRLTIFDSIAGGDIVMYKKLK